jgi:hypothetical protein
MAMMYYIYSLSKNASQFTTLGLYTPDRTLGNLYTYTVRTFGASNDGRSSDQVIPVESAFSAP